VSERMELLHDVFECMDCDALGLTFAKRPFDRRFFRFPPVIGAAKDVAVLFIGINPRISSSNEMLHQHVSDDMPAFAAFAANRINGVPYIAKEGKERHYRWHARMINDLFPNRLFEEVAAVTELYFCASIDARGLDRLDNPCAKKFMTRVFVLMRPRAVVAVGRPVERYLRRFMCNSSTDQLFVIRIGGHTITVVTVPHPNYYGERSAKWKWATATVECILSGQSGALPRPSIGDAPVPTAGRPATGARSDDTIMRRTCEWHERYGWKPFQRPADLDALETVRGARIEFHLTRDGRTEFVLSMTADQWKAALGRYYVGPNWRRNGYAVPLTRCCGGRPVAEFVARWEPYIRRLTDA
jgi:hypothetical protein